MGESMKNSCAAKAQEEGKHAVSKINRDVSMKIVKEDSEGCNTPAVRKRREVDKTKGFYTTISNKKKKDLIRNLF